MYCIAYDHTTDYIITGQSKPNLENTQRIQTAARDFHVLFFAV